MRARWGVTTRGAQPRRNDPLIKLDQYQKGKNQDILYKIDELGWHIIPLDKLSLVWRAPFACGRTTACTQASLYQYK